MRKCLLICLLLLLLAAFPAAAAEALPVAENERLALYLSNDCAGIEILDKQTGVKWSSSMNDEEFFSTQKINATIKKKMSSMLMINYTNLNQGLGSINNMAILADKLFEASYEKIENGVRLHYVFGSCSIELDIEVTLDKSSVLISVPYSGIHENGVYSIVSLDLMPYFCSASDWTDGFFFYPDGSGALMQFTDNAHMGEKTKLYSVYGSLEKHETLLGFFDTRSPEVLLPVFGMNLGGQGVVCAIEKGAESSQISLNPSNKIVRANYLFANFLYRRGFDDKRVTDRSFKIYDKKPIETDYALRILFLDDGRASYSDMAVAYRDYLLSSGQIERNVTEPSALIDIFLTANEKGLLFDTPRTVTTLPQAEEMLKSLSEDGVQNVQAALKGWSSDGYGNSPDHLPVSGSTGGNEALKKLLETAKTLNYDVSLIANFIEAKATQGGYSHRNDIVYTGNYAILTDEEESIFILSPDISKKKLDDFIASAKDFPVSGLRLEWLGNTLAYNYFSKRYITVSETLSFYNEMLAGTEAAFGSASVQGGSLYAAQGASLMTEIPMSDNRYQYTTESVPFYQIVMHGVRDYTGTPGNLSSDMEREVLRWVEMGYLPYFELAWSDTEDLMYTEYQSLFSAKFSDWREEAARIAKQFQSGELAQLHGALITRHDKLSADVRRVTYDNGLTVYVNYSQEAAVFDGLTIPARDYIVVEGVSR